MDHTPPPIDEYTLASFMAGTLPEDRHKEVAAYLAQNADARELLQMAYEALEAAQQTDELLEIPLPATLPDLPAALPVPPERDQARRPARRAAARMHGLSRFTALAVLVFTVGLGLRLTFGPPTDALRSSQPRSNAIELAVHDSRAGLAFAWNKIPEAYLYRIVVWDLQEAEVVGRTETQAHRLDQSHTFVADLGTRLQAGRTYTLRVDAVDAQNRLIQESEPVEFTPRD